MKVNNYIYNYIIIGGGISGIGAAEIIHKKNYSYILLEKKNKIGGHVLTKKYNNCYFDLGFVYGNDDYKELLKKVKKYNIPIKKHVITYSVSNNGKHVFSNNKYSNKNLYKEAQLFQNIARQKKLWWWFISFEQFCNIYKFSKEFKKNVLTPALSILFITSNSFKKPAGMIVNNLQKFIKVHGILPSLWSVKGGNINIINSIINEYNLNIKLNSNVINVIKKNCLWYVYTNNEMYTCKKLIFTCGPHIINKILYNKTIFQNLILNYAIKNTKKCYGLFHNYCNIISDDKNKPKDTLYHYEINENGWILTGDLKNHTYCNNIDCLYLSLSDNYNMLSDIPEENIIKKYTWFHPTQDRINILLFYIIKIAQFIESNNLYFAGSWTTIICHEYAYTSGIEAAKRSMSIFKKKDLIIKIIIIILLIYILKKIK